MTHRRPTLPFIIACNAVSAIVLFIVLALGITDSKAAFIMLCVNCVVMFFAGLRQCLR